MWRSKRIYKIKILNKVWEIVLAATTWTIWLFRNESSFHSKEPDTKVMLHLIKSRTLSWGLAFGLILKEKSSWWFDNPSGVVTAILKTKWFNLLIEEDYSLEAFMDGSWKKVGHHNKRGIGGLVKTAQGDHLLEFVGPVSTQSAYQTELQALKQLVAL